MPELLLGSGNDRTKRLWMPDEGIPREWTKLVTVDFDRSSDPDIVWDLNDLPWPFLDNIFDEVHAYEIMEHLGRQGDFVAFFNHFYEIWRMLKPDGMLVMTVPRWDKVWAWSDPGHTRIISQQMLSFLDQTNYDEIGRTTRTDYRQYWHGDFEAYFYQENDDTLLAVLKARKHESTEDRQGT